MLIEIEESKLNKMCFMAHWRETVGASFIMKVVKDMDREQEYKEIREQVFRRMRNLTFWFANEFLKEEDRACIEEKEAERLKEERPDELVCMILTAECNAHVMKDCMRAARDAAVYLRNKENEVEMWQLCGINAMLDRCDEEGIIPFDLPYVVEAMLSVSGSLVVERVKEDERRNEKK